jgi:hypothetical protein
MATTVCGSIKRAAPRRVLARGKLKRPGWNGRPTEYGTDKAEPVPPRSMAQETGGIRSARAIDGGSNRSGNVSFQAPINLLIQLKPD